METGRDTAALCRRAALAPPLSASPRCTPPRLIRQSIARLRDDADHSASATFDLATRTIGRTPGATAPLRSSGHAVATAIWSTWPAMNPGRRLGRGG